MKTRMMRFTTGLCVLFMLAIEAPAMADESLEYSIAKGGRLYDKWFKENGIGTPKVANPTYPEDGKYKGKKGADWRCKECHGWDYKGAEGAYSSGKHATGIKGVQNATGLEPDAVTKILRDAKHGYDESMLTVDDAKDLANFITQGQLDMSAYIDDKSKRANGNVDSGKKYYQTLCVSCHGLDGKAEEDAPPLGQLSNKNPWEVMHKIMNGQPNEDMPAFRALDISVTVDILSYMQKSLPAE